MRMLKEKKVTSYQYDVEFEDREADLLAKRGLELICGDKEALINYAFNRILREQLSKNKSPVRRKRVSSRRSKSL